MAIRPITGASLAQAGQFAQTDVHVFLAGPSIDPSKTYTDITDDQPDFRGKRARHFLFEQISNEGYDVILGEHKQLIAEGKDIWKEAANLAVIEMGYIKQFDCVIILPSSVGSFCEFGLFSANEHVCSRMLTVLDSVHADPPGYLHLGPAKLAAHQKAKIETLDYEQLDNILERSLTFLESIRRNKVLRKVLHE